MSITIRKLVITGSMIIIHWYDADATALSFCKQIHGTDETSSPCYEDIYFVIMTSVYNMQCHKNSLRNKRYKFRMLVVPGKVPVFIIVNYSFHNAIKYLLYVYTKKIDVG